MLHLEGIVEAKKIKSTHSGKTHREVNRVQEFEQHRGDKPAKPGEKSTDCSRGICNTGSEVVVKTKKPEIPQKKTGRATDQKVLFTFKTGIRGKGDTKGESMDIHQTSDDQNFRSNRPPRTSPKK